METRRMHSTLSASAHKSRSNNGVVTRSVRAALVLVLASAFALTPLARAQYGRGSGNTPPAVQGQNVNGMHIYMWAGLKSHGEGAHDYPLFLADWSKVLTEHGAVVDGAFHPPSAADLEKTDVVVIYKGDAGFLSDAEKEILEAYVKRGGGLVSFHDSLCGPDPGYFSTLVGGAKRHGEVNYSQGQLAYTVVDKGNPILKDFGDMTITDESFYSITWAPVGMHPLVNTVIPGGDHKGEVVTEMWTYEHTVPGGQPARAFVWMQGHVYTNFAIPQIQSTLLRGIAWAGKKPVDELAAYVAPPAAARGGRGGSGRGGRGASGGGGRGAQAAQ